jgi:hypothetical protein
MTDTTPQDGASVTNINGQAPGAAVNVNPPAGGTTVDTEAWWTEASSKHGFKSKEEVYKSWSEAQKKISEDGEKLKNFELFQENVVPVLDVVLKDEEILGKVKARMEGKTPTQDSALKPVAPQEDPETKRYLVDEAVRGFEISHGIDKLDPETQKEVKAKIGAELKKFTDGREPKISSLKNQLEDSFQLAMTKDEKLKKLFTTKEDDGLSDYGSLPSQSSAVSKNGEIRLTPEQEKIAQNMPGGREAYIKGLKKIQGK